MNAKNILEIGTYDGNTTLNLAVNSPFDTLITTVDITDKAQIGSQYRDTDYSKKIIQIFGDSAKIDWSRMSIPFDIVFIDGCHYCEYVNKDTQNAMRYLKSGGIIVWHDYGMIKAVSEVADETAKRIKVKAIRGTRLAIGFME